jgi:hypothetical protein
MPGQNFEQKHPSVTVSSVNLSNLSHLRVHPRPAAQVGAPALVRPPAPVRPAAVVRAPSSAGADVNYDKIREAVAIVEATMTQMDLLAQQIQALSRNLSNVNRIIIFSD